MSFQVFSDLHLEFYNKIPQIKPKADYLVLAGDISTVDTLDKLESFFQYCTSRWEKIIYICGNHEFYDELDRNIENIGENSNSLDNENNLLVHIKDKYKNICDKFPNIYFLDNNYITINNTVIYGFIGWTPLDSRIIQSGYLNLCDFYNIKLSNNKLLTPKVLVDISNYELNKFKSFINEINTNQISCESLIVITHFPPLREGTSSPIFNNSPLQSYFSWNNLIEEENISCEKLKIWISGHTHWSYDITKNGVRYFSNQVGYPQEGIKFDEVGILDKKKNNFFNIF